MTSIQIYRYESGKYKFDLQVFKKIINKSKDNLVALYSMTGPLRMGKSFMLGFFLRYLQTKGKGDWISHELDNTFKYRSGSVRETTGIWIWDKPFDVQRRDGTKVSIFLLDTQGCFDDQTSMQDNAIIFALSTLLSSVMIFNIQRQLSEDLLQFLQYFAGFAKLMNNEDNTDEPFQRLMFLIRDWEYTDYKYGFYDENTSIDGKNFMTDKLNPRNGQPLEIKYVHQMILSTFDDISCYLMPYPGKEVALSSSFNPTSVEPLFLKQIKEFVPLVLKDEAIVPKRIGGQYVTGAQLIARVEKWEEVFKFDTFPESKTLFESTAELHNEMAKTAAIDEYCNQMKIYLNKNINISEYEFENYHRKIRTESIKLFESFKRLGGKTFEDKYLAIIDEKLKEFYEYFLALLKSKYELKSIETQMSEESNRLVHEIENNKKILNELKAENKREKQLIEEKIQENEKQLKEMKKFFTEELERKGEQNLKLYRELEALKNISRVPKGGGWLTNLIHGIVEVVEPVVRCISLVKGVLKK